MRFLEFIKGDILVVAQTHFRLGFRCKDIITECCTLSFALCEIIFIDNHVTCQDKFYSSCVSCLE